MDYQTVAVFLAGLVTSGGAMLIRGDFLGRRQADEVERRLNGRVDREMTVIGRELTEIKETLVRLESRR